ncbi:MAG: hypothetical protein PHF80_05085 [Methanothrix sp.]|nr:hypothetical protein [Methanothrix sp.]
MKVVNEKAFGQPAEAEIVGRLLQRCPGLLSPIAFGKWRCDASGCR